MKSLDEVYSYLKNITEEDFRIAGGCVISHILGTKTNDFDIFCGREAYGQIEANLYFNAKLVKERKCSKVFEMIDGTIIDIVKCESPVSHIYKFDLKLCCVGWDDRGVVDYTSESVDLIKSQIITLNEVTYPYITFKRIKRYMSKGFNVSEKVKQTIMDMCWEVNDSEKLDSGYEL